MTTLIVKSPAQAANIFDESGSAPRQRHVFMVRFHANVNVGLSPMQQQALTFVVKQTDRPKVNIKTEELNQYNKKRQIYTGFKHEPIKMTFWDSADGAAQNMWNAYARYYFGDFSSQAVGGYGYDVTTDQYRAGAGFGLTEGYNGNTGQDATTAQWFFSQIEIFHFYNGSYDKYMLLNPRITTYDPDELDYESNNVSQISLQVVYENLQYFPNKIFSASAFSEFTTGEFYANPLADNTVQTTLGHPTYSSAKPVNPPVGSLLSRLSTTNVAAPYRTTPIYGSGGSLGNYGNFSFGSGSSTSFNNGGINGASFDTISSGVAGNLSSAYGSAGSTLTTGLMTTQGGQTSTQSGTTLSPAAYSAINAQQTGTAQYGVNAGSQSGAIDPNTYLTSINGSGNNATVADAPMLA